MAFAIWAPICWGILAILMVIDILGDIVLRLGFPWGLFPPVFLAGVPLYCLYLFLFPSALGPWPVNASYEEVGNEEVAIRLLLKNENYVRLFAVTNLEKLWFLLDCTVTPHRSLIKRGPSGENILDPSFAEGQPGAQQEPKGSGTDLRS